MSDQISVTVADGVGHVTLDRPQALNALSYEMIRELTDVFESWIDDSEVGLVLVSTSFVACFLVLGVGAGILVHRAGRGVGKLAAFRPAR